MSVSNLMPIWLDKLSCSSSDSSLSACVHDDNIIGYADCLRTSSSSIVAVDCGMLTVHALIANSCACSHAHESSILYYRRSRII